jgi:hypothetical protein
MSKRKRENAVQDRDERSTRELSITSNRKSKQIQLGRTGMELGLSLEVGTSNFDKERNQFKFPK